MSITCDFNVWFDSTKIEGETIREGLIEGLQRVCSAPGFHIEQKDGEVLVNSYGTGVTLRLKTDVDRRNFIKFVERMEIDENFDTYDGFQHNVDGANT